MKYCIRLDVQKRFASHFSQAGCNTATLYKHSSNNFLLEYANVKVKIKNGSAEGLEPLRRGHF
jgi:hypothetical protein